MFFSLVMQDDVAQLFTNSIIKPLIKEEGQNMDTEVIFDIANAALTLSAVLIAFHVSRRDIRLHRKEVLYRQASLVATWLLDFEFEENETELFYNVAISNQSYQPIYDVVISAGTVHGAGTPYYRGDESNSCIQTVPPGLYKVKVPSFGGAMQMTFSSAISFRDINNNGWRRDAKGYLKKTANNPLIELEITHPPRWVSIEPLQNV